MSNNHLLKQLAEHMQNDLADAIGAQEEEILRAIAKASETGTDSEEPVKFGVTLRGVLNLDANTVETAFSFTTRTSVKEKHPLEDPKQGNLPLEGVQLVPGCVPHCGPATGALPSRADMIAEKIEATLADAGLKQGKDGVFRKEGEE
jgi:hypothetical protein